MRKKPTGSSHGYYRWIKKQEVRHWRSGKMIRRRDGLPFVFRVRSRN